MKTNTLNNEWLTKLCSIIERHLPAGNLSNAQLAVFMNMSERQFYRTVLKLSGKTPNQYLTEFRMKKAMEVMRTGNYKTVRELSFALGYKKDSYFSTLFKKEHGLSPLEMLRTLGLRARTK